MFDLPLLAPMKDEEPAEDLWEETCNARWGIGLLILVASELSCLVNVEGILDISYTTSCLQTLSLKRMLLGKIGNSDSNGVCKKEGFLFFQLG